MTTAERDPKPGMFIRFWRPSDLGGDGMRDGGTYGPFAEVIVDGPHMLASTVMDGPRQTIASHNPNLGWIVRWRAGSYNGHPTMDDFAGRQTYPNMYIFGSAP